jgi:hypothetical protein
VSLWHPTFVSTWCLSEVQSMVLEWLCSVAIQPSPRALALRPVCKSTATAPTTFVAAAATAVSAKLITLPRPAYNSRSSSLSPAIWLGISRKARLVYTKAHFARLKKHRLAYIDPWKHSKTLMLPLVYPQFPRLPAVETSSTVLVDHFLKRRVETSLCCPLDPEDVI